MARTSNLAIHRNDRAAFVGTTGSGKTTLAKAMMWGQKHVIVIDPKRTFTLPESFLPGFPALTLDAETKKASGWEDNPKVADVVKFVTNWQGPGPLIYRPSVDETAEPDLLDWLFYWILDRGNTLLYIDETTMATKKTQAPRGLMGCIQLGRERGVGTWCATQRPVNIPIICISEAEHMFTFRLRHPDDRQRMADYSDPRVAEPFPAKYSNGFWYYHDKSQTLKFYQRANIGPALSGKGGEKA